MTSRERKYLAWKKTLRALLERRAVHITRPKKCDDCGKYSDGLMTCYYPNGEETRLCPDCLDKDGSFCKCCGHFWAGCEDFDFSPMPGYCSNCRDEIKSDFGEFEEDADDEIYYPDDV